MATKDIGSLRTRLAFEDDGALRSLTRFRDDLKGLRSEMRTITSQGKEYAGSLKGLKQQQDILSREVKTHQERVRELRKRYEESAKVKGEDAKQTRDLATQYNNAVTALNRTEENLKQVTQAIQDQQNPWKRLGEQAEAAGEKMQSVGQGLSNFGRDYTMRVTAPIVASSAAMFKFAVDWESAWAGVEKVVDATPEQLKELEQGIRDMAKELPVASEELADIAANAGQLGIETSSIKEFTRTMVDLSQSTNLTSEQASMELARLANITQMSQKDFDRLGSSLVALGNTMATQENEISSMSLRLAAQASQVGMTEAQILALAASMSSLGIESEAGGTAMSTVLKRIQTAVDEGEESLASFAKVAGVTADEFAKTWESSAVDALDLFIKGLGQSSEQGENLTGILKDLGITGIRESDTLLRLAGASDILSDAVETSTQAWEENTALTEEAEKRYETTESKLKVMWNRIKDVGIELGEALVPAITSTLDAIQPLINKIAEGAEAFSELSEEEQQAILKKVALVAAIGPVSSAMGGLISTVGGLSRGFGSLVGALGKSSGGGKGTGLLGRLGGLGKLGVAGLAIGGIGALTYSIYELIQASKESLEETVNSIQTRKEELDVLDEAIEKYELLQIKNRLTTDEVLRYMDNMDRLKGAKSQDAIAEITKEQEELLEKSGLTNDEMEEFLAINDKIIEKAPDAAQAISEQGNAYAETTEAVKELTRIERQKLTEDTYRALTDELSNQVANLEKQKELHEDIANLEKERENYTRSIIDNTKELRAMDLEIVELKDRMVKASGEEQAELTLQLQALQLERDLLDQKIGKQEESIENIDKEIGKKQKSLEETNKELELYDELLNDYAQMVLYEQGIVSEKGKAIEAIQKEQREIDSTRALLKQKLEEEKISLTQYQEQNRQLDEQQDKLNTAKRKLEEFNEVAGDTIFNFSTLKGTVQEINIELAKEIHKNVLIRTSFDDGYRKLSDPTSKTVNIITTGGGRHLELKGYAAGTNVSVGKVIMVGGEL